MGQIMAEKQKCDIDGVVVQPLKQFTDERGKVMHMLRSDSPLFEHFGEIYFSLVNSGVVKAWKLHHKMTQYFAVPMGTIRLVIYDDRAESSTRGQRIVTELGKDNYCLVKIPPKLWYGFKGVDNGPSLIANCTDYPHDPQEQENIAPAEFHFNYQW